MQTSESLQHPCCKPEQLTLFAAGSHASHTAEPGSETAQRMTVISGRKCFALSKNSGRLGLLEKMLMESSIWNSTTCWLTWKVQATPAGRLLFRLSPSMPKASGREYGSLLPTLTVTDATGRAYQYDRGNKDCPRLTLAGVMRLLPTLTASDSSGGAAYRKPPARQGGFMLKELLKRNGGRLEPEFCEWLMGYPIGWTKPESKRLETPSYLSLYTDFLKR